ncbi:MAG: CDP-alcohol phosphatidyltransferase family protein [Ignavibacteriales bacterium]|nr:CDP-alcohol phosphatidyltransferase family protein [Ignavibacteriales bacterium]
MGTVLEEGAKDRIWTISNLLSLSRILLMIPVVYFYVEKIPYYREWSLFVILVAMITDALDGYIARVRNEVSELGKIIDPLADKLGIGIVVVLMTVTGDIPFWYAALILGRDVLIFLGGLYIKITRQIILASTMEGKVAVVVIAIALAFYMLQNPMFVLLGEIALWLSILMIAYSSAVYLKRFIKALRSDGGKKIAAKDTKMQE